MDETITNENRFNGDWDGNWKHATSEDGDTWSAEYLIPWYIARELAPLSDLFVVYGRGGSIFNEFSADPLPLLQESFALRDADQLLVKISYRFEK